MAGLISGWHIYIDKCEIGNTKDFYEREMVKWLHLHYKSKFRGTKLDKLGKFPRTNSWVTTCDNSKKGEGV